MKNVYIDQYVHVHSTEAQLYLGQDGKDKTKLNTCRRPNSNFTDAYIHFIKLDFH